MEAERQDQRWHERWQGKPQLKAESPKWRRQDKPKVVPAWALAGQVRVGGDIGRASSNQRRVRAKGGLGAGRASPSCRRGGTGCGVKKASSRGSRCGRWEGRPE